MCTFTQKSPRGSVLNGQLKVAMCDAIPTKKGRVKCDSIFHYHVTMCRMKGLAVTIYLYVSL